MPQLYVISGCNGAGKTTASYALLPEMLGCSQFVNSDEFAKSLSPFSPDAVSIQASKLMLLKMNYLFKRNEDFAIETTLATRSLKKTITKARAQGYGITILYFWLNSPELAVERVRARVAAGGHNIPEETIRRRYMAGLHYFFNIYRKKTTNLYNLQFLIFIFHFHLLMILECDFLAIYLFHKFH